MTRVQAEEFIYREVRLLDRGQWRAWRALIAADGLYWVPSGDPDADPDAHCSVIYCDPQALDDRLERAESGFYWVGQPPIRSVHVVSNVLVDAAPGNPVQVECNQVIYLYREGDARRDQPLHILPARCEYRLVEGEGGWRIACKKVVLLQGDGLLPLLPPIL
jgi:benzoate/toluate 1,2-dioxygenase subunit beta